MELPKMKTNFGSGPRVGNASRDGKRAAFQEGKQERAGLADEINRAYELRVKGADTVVHGLENVEEPIKPKKFKK